MNKNNNIYHIGYPVTFNPFKHHFGFLKAQTDKWKKQYWEVVKNDLNLIGNNMIDLYCGNLKVEEIIEACFNFAMKKNITDAGSLQEWLFPKEFKKIKLSDHSEWVVRQGLNSANFLHIHPAKYSPSTIRIRASVLKTVLALKILEVRPENNNLPLQLVNRIRKEKLGLSPVKSITKGKGIDRIWSIFNN